MLNDIHRDSVTLWDNFQDGKGAITSQRRKIEFILKNNHHTQMRYTTHFKMFYIVINGKCIKHKQLSTIGTIKIVKYLDNQSLSQDKIINLENRFVKLTLLQFSFVIRKLLLLISFTNMLIHVFCIRYSVKHLASLYVARLTTLRKTN